MKEEVKKQELKKLFEEIYEKPVGLDEQIMLKIQQEAKSEQVETTKKSFFWIWMYVGVGLIAVVGIVYMFIQIDFQSEQLYWLMGLAVILPYILDKTIGYRWTSKKTVTDLST